MSESILTPEGGTPAPTTPEPNTPAASGGMFIEGADGHVLAPDFVNHLGDESRPYANVLDRFKGQSIETVFKSFGEANKTISEGGRVLPFPAADAPPAEMERWRATHGLNDEFKPSDYGLTPEEPPEGFNEEFSNKMAEKMLARGVPPALAKGLAQDYFDLEQEIARDMDMKIAAQQKEAQENLKRSLGPNYDATISKIRTVVAAQGFDPDDGEIFGNPNVVGMLAKVTGLLGEDTIASMKESVGVTGAFAGDDYARGIDIIENPANPLHERYTNGDPDVAAEVNRLLAGGR